MKSGDILGHENMGEVVEVGSEVKNLKVGDRVVVPFTIACGECFFCRNGFYSGCERTRRALTMNASALSRTQRKALVLP
jgi:threonine dehydrogenase-like Zn-dependent dehydrogenase